MKYFLSLFCVASMYFATGTANAEFIVDMQEVNGNVVAIGSGSFNTSDLILLIGGGTETEYVLPSLGELSIGGTGATGNFNLYLGFSGPISFGSGGGAAADTFSGDFVALVPIDGIIALPLGYVSGAPLSSTGTWASQSFSSLGISVGTYTWNWGSGANADSYTLNVTAVPEPSSIALVGLGLVGAVAGLRFRKRYV